MTENLAYFSSYCFIKTNELGHEKICLMSYANNKGVDQPAHPRSLISAFVVCCLDSIISLDSIAKISRLQLASVAAQANLCLAWRNSRRHVLSTRVSNVCHRRPKINIDANNFHKEPKFSTL